MTNSESSFIVSSMYDLLKPDGINVIELGSGKYQLMRPAALSNLHNIAFRSFTGDLLPFTTIELPKLKAELIMMTNGLKSATLTGQDTMDLPAVNTYENTKQNIILSIDKAWTYNKDAESQVIYNIEEIVELMNEKLKDYFLYTGLVNIYISSPYMQVFYDSTVRGYRNKYLSAMLQDVTTNAFKCWQFDASASTVNVVPFDSYLSPTNCKICFIDYLSNAGLWMKYDNDGSNALATVISYDSTNNKYTHNGSITINPNTGMLGDLYLRGARTPPGICVSFPSTASSGYQAFAFLYSYKSTVPRLLIHASIDGLYKMLSVNLSYAINWPALGSYNQIYFFGFDIATKDLYIAITYDSTPENDSHITYAKLALNDFDISKGSGEAVITLTPTSMQYTLLGDGLFRDWYNNRMDLAANMNLCNIDLKSSGGVLVCIANQFLLEFNGTNVTNCHGYGRNFFKVGSDIMCREYDTDTHHYHLCKETSPVIQMNRTIEPYTDEFVIKYFGTSTVDYDVGTNHSRVSVIPFKSTYNQTANAYYVYDGHSVLSEPSFNYNHEVNCKDIATVNSMNVTCTAKDPSNNTVALNPPNGGYLCSNVEDFIKLDAITVADNAITGLVTIPQIEFASDYVLNFNLKIYSDPYYFNIYTSRDFTQQGHAFNLDVNHTDLYYRASNVHVLDTLEYLILLKYNYNLVKLRVYGFPNSDGMVFNMNENAYVSFKNMPTDNTMNSLIIELIGDDDEALPSEVLQQLFGKVSLAIDWMQ